MATALETLRAQATAKLNKTTASNGLNHSMDVADPVKATSEEVEAETKFQHYYSTQPHCRFVFNDGSEVTFAFGRFSTNDPQRIKELNAILPPKGNNPLIYRMDTIPEDRPKPTIQSILEGAVAIAEAGMQAHQHVRTQQQTAPMQISDPASQNSSLDQDLVKAANKASMLGDIKDEGQVVTPVDPEKAGIPGAMSSAS